MKQTSFLNRQRIFYEKHNLFIRTTAVLLWFILIGTVSLQKSYCIQFLQIPVH